MDNKIFITLGSQKFQFNRLLKAVDELCEKGTVDEENYDMNMDVATAIMSIRVSTDQCLMAGKMILHKFKSQGLCFLASKMVFVFIARIKTDDIVMGLDFVVSVVFSILVIEHFTLKIKGVGIAVYSIHVKFAAEHHAPVFIKERF